MVGFPRCGVYKHRNRKPLYSVRRKVRTEHTLIRESRTLRGRVRSVQGPLRRSCVRVCTGDDRVGIVVHEDLVLGEGEREQADGLHDLRQRQVACADVDQRDLLGVRRTDVPQTSQMTDAGMGLLGPEDTVLPPVNENEVVQGTRFELADH